MSSFVAFVRAPGTPVYGEVDPRDQEEICSIIRQFFVSDVHEHSDRDVVKAMVRFAAIAALSGRPDVLTLLMPHFKCDQTDASLVAAVNGVCEKQVFFRGGQAHGNLKKTDVGAAVLDFCQDKLDGLSANCCQWGLATLQAERAAGVRQVFQTAAQCAKGFGAGDYWTKRFIEILILCSAARLFSFEALPEDIDRVADIWPVASGTKAALLRIFPTMRRPEHHRQALRVLQRRLGGGQRAVALTRVSAFLCFWKRAEDGSLNWVVPVPKDAAPLV